MYTIIINFLVIIVVDNISLNLSNEMLSPKATQMGSRTIYSYKNYILLTR